MSKPGPDVFFDFEVNGKRLGRVVFHLYDDIVPNTARNFRELATGVHGFGYRGTPIHRIVPDFMIQGGDVTNKDGTGGRSIFGEKFYDESFKIKHTKSGLLSMANMGYNTNSSQFFITTCPAPWINGRNVVFGEVVSGYHHITHIQEKYATDDILRRPKDKIVISKCGVVSSD